MLRHAESTLFVVDLGLREDRSDLWKAHQTIRSIRNNFVHRGKAAQGRKEQEVGYDQARKLLKQADEISTWVEEVLPRDMRRPRSQRRIQVVIAKQPTWGPDGPQGIAETRRTV